MPAAGKTLGRWFGELRRRKVFRVALAYLVGGWVLIQVADATFEPLGLSTVAHRFVIVAVVLGFPLACVLAWAFDLTRHGIERTPAAAPVPVETPAVAPRSHSIAVLPFADMSPAHDQGYFCEGIAEEIINSMCCVGGLRVASRTSAFQFRDRNVDVREIGRLLGVTSVLEGSVRKSGDRIRITAQLVDCADGYHHWSESFDRDLDDVFAIQTEIARSLVAALRLTLTPRERALIDRGGTRNAEAYDLYLRAQALLRDHTDATLPQAAALFEQATRRDPDFAQAHAGLANAIAIKGQWQLGVSEVEFEKAIRASQRALDLEPQMPEAFLARACLLSMQGRVGEADEAFAAALNLNPGSYDSNYLYARHEFSNGRAAHAAELFEAAHRLRPDEYQPLCMLEAALQRLGRRDEQRRVLQLAMATLESRLRLDPNDGRALHLAAVSAAKLGDRARTEDYAQRALQSGGGEFSTAYNLACAYSALGDIDRALALLDAAVRSGRGNLGWIEHDPDLDKLRSDPRFAALCAKLRRPGTPVGA
jgi:adenylate cyclase